MWVEICEQSEGFLWLFAGVKPSFPWTPEALSLGLCYALASPHCIYSHEPQSPNLCPKPHPSQDQSLCCSSLSIRPDLPSKRMSSEPDSESSPLLFAAGILSPFTDKKTEAQREVTFQPDGGRARMQLQDSDLAFCYPILLAKEDE